MNVLYDSFLSQDPSLDENKNLRNNNFNPIEVEKGATTPKKSLDEEIIPDNHHPDDKNVDDNKSDSSGVYKVNTPDRDRATSFFAQPGILAGQCPYFNILVVAELKPCMSMK